MIEIWHNRQTGCPSVQVGPITIDLLEETPAQAILFQRVMNHPEAHASGAVRAPVTQEIADAVLQVLQEEVGKFIPSPKKRMGHTVEVSVGNSRKQK